VQVNGAISIIGTEARNAVVEGRCKVDTFATGVIEYGAGSTKVGVETSESGGMPVVSTRRRMGSGAHTPPGRDGREVWPVSCRKHNKPMRGC
jgi:hypothetical protein